MTDGTGEYDAATYRVSFFYGLAKASVNRMAFALAQELKPHGATAVSLTPGRLRSEAMLDAYGVTEANRRDAIACAPHFAISESPAFVGRAVAALAQDPEVARWNGQSLSSGQLAQVYGFTALDGRSPRRLEVRPRRPGRGPAGRRGGLSPSPPADRTRTPPQPTRSRTARATQPAGPPAVRFPIQARGPGTFGRSASASPSFPGALVVTRRSESTDSPRRHRCRPCTRGSSVTS